MTDRKSDWEISFNSVGLDQNSESLFCVSTSRRKGLRTKNIMNKLTDIALFEIKDEGGFRRDLVHVRDDGSLNFDSFDCGKFSNDMWGGDFEYSLDIDAKWKDTLLLILLKERFSAIKDFREWAQSKEIPYTEGGW
jgi:hypothetical protein